MNGIRKWVCLLIATALGVFALPGFAVTPNKHFSLGMAVTSVTTAQTDTVVTATFTNDNPSGSSASFGSLTLTVDNVSGIHITSVELDPIYGGAISAQANTSVSIINIGPIKATQFYTLKLHISGCGDLNTWSAVVYSGTNLSGTTYTNDSPPAQNVTNIPCDNVACGGLVTGITVSELIDTLTTGVQGQKSSRGPVNQDGTCSSGVNYFVTEFLSPANNTYVHFRWTSEPSAVFFYILDQPATNPPLFSWKTIGDEVSGTPIFVKGQPCDLGANVQFPGSYGTVVQDNGGKNIKVDSSTAVNAVPLTVPFRIAIGPKPIEEFMTVTKVSGQTWTVIRGANSQSHPVGTVVMSTPAPALAGPLVCYDNTGATLQSCPKATYVVGGPALMCYVSPAPNNDTTKTYVFDIGDGWTLGR